MPPGLVVYNVPMSIPQESNPSMIEQQKGLRKRFAARRTATLHFACTPETKARIQKAANDLMMNKAEFLEWLITRYAKGMVIVMEEGAFLDGIFKTLERRTIDKSMEVSYQTTIQTLKDKGFIG